MPRSLLAGMTDYSHQTFEDMVSDLGKWVEGLGQVIIIITENINKLEENGYWDEVSYDFKATVYYSLKFYETSVREINNILLEFGKEVREDNVVMIKRMFKVDGDSITELTPQITEEEMMTILSDVFMFDMTGEGFNSLVLKSNPFPDILDIAKAIIKRMGE